MKMTAHATKRWSERFSALDVESEWNVARRVGKKLRAKIREKCPAHAHLVTGLFKGFYYRLSPRGALFVVTPPETVVTVFQLSDEHAADYIRQTFGVAVMGTKV